MEAVTNMIAQKQKSSYTVQPKDGKFQVFDKDHKFRQSFATDLDARAFVAACECQAHARAKRTVAQLAAAPLLALALLVAPLPAHAAPVWRCTTRYIRVIHWTQDGKKIEWARITNCAWGK